MASAYDAITGARDAVGVRRADRFRKLQGGEAADQRRGQQAVHLHDVDATVANCLAGTSRVDV
jgi:hypothetical protein